MRQVVFYTLILLLTTQFSNSQEAIDSSNYEAALINPKEYSELVLNGDIYLKFKDHEKSFIKVKKIILYNSYNLILPSSFSGFTNLEELVISGCDKINLTSNMEVISALKSLKIIEITNCKIKCLPENFITINQTSITKISLSFNQITSLPKNISLLDVDTFDISNNPISHNSIVNLAKNNCILELYLNNCNITNFPKELGVMKNLKFLSLLSNKIKKLDKKYNNFQALVALSLTGNPLDKIETSFIDNDKGVIIDFIK